MRNYSNLKAIRRLVTHQKRLFGLELYHRTNLQNLIGVNSILSDDIDNYLVDWTKHYKGGSLVCIPSTIEDLCKVCKYCYDNHIEMVPQGGNTGLVGGGVGVAQEIIVSSRSLNKILSLDRVNGVLVCESGCITQHLMEFVSLNGFYLPIDLGSKGSCTIGGNIATNAGGMRVLRYGSWHHNVLGDSFTPSADITILGLEVVLADGTVLDMLRTLKKDNCGYHLPHIFIGSEGTLGYITKVAIQLYPAPQASFTIFARINSFIDVSHIYTQAQSALGEVLSAFEIMDSQSLELLQQINPQLISRFKSYISSDPASAYLLFEIHSGSNNYEMQLQRLELFLEPLLASAILSSAIISQDKSQENQMWSIREHIPITLAQCSQNNSLTGPFLLKYDISVSLHAWMEVMNEVVTYLRRCGYHADHGGCFPPIWPPESLNNPKGDCFFSIYCFGHGGDQNLHLNVLLSLRPVMDQHKENFETIKVSCKAMLDDAVLQAVMKRRGSMSAEHGIGQQKRHLLPEIRSKEEMRVMKMLKSSFDPTNIMNPNKIL